jgi:hypothetical protein
VIIAEVTMIHKFSDLPSIEELIDNVENTLENWINNHTPGVDMTTRRYGYECLHEAYKEQYILFCNETEERFYCARCGSHWDQFEIEDWNKCPDCGLFCKQYDLDDWTQFVEVEDVYYDSDFEMLLHEHGGWHYAAIAEEIAFEKWIDKYFPALPYYVDEAGDALGALQDAQDKLELFEALAMALHCVHMGGMIIEDNCNYYHIVDAIQQDGWNSVYDDADLAYFFD